MSMCAFDSIQMRAAHGATAVSGRTFRWNGRALLIEVGTRTQAAPTACRLLPANDHALRGASGSDALRATLRQANAFGRARAWHRCTGISREKLDSHWEAGKSDAPQETAWIITR